MSKIIKSTHSNANQASKKTISIIKRFQRDDEISHSQENDNNLENEQGNTEEDEKNTLNRLKKDIEQQKAEAEAILHQAHQEADDIRQQIKEQLEHAEQEKDQLFEQAKQNGYEEGFSKGQNDGLQSYNELIDQAKNIVTQSEQQFNHRIEEAEPLIIELATALAKRIIGNQLIDDQQNWTSMLKQVINEVREHEDVKIYVHPDWYELTVSQQEELVQLLSHCDHLFIYPDAGLMKHGCVIETKHGRIDASMDRQLKELKTQLLAKLKEDSR
ncbi:flagellar assembly protein FliH [Halalkalibacter sp. APA_J-10(15)]|uniref:flagellar assembly protein FliH n=1 Tax=Halalkalibacter sp. APA_J-10(15) TaxID=2933805 RepID=UPI001FF1F426|nr:flagellar assembly protein FliH [Halalkalibacter sp. APA_J-10(15)]MCK0470752.1 flagellar assembly protein FliH [Halalkalibacter sp. APA_J-10(15)]